jgi:hypothetical protein
VHHGHVLSNRTKAGLDRGPATAGPRERTNKIPMDALGGLVRAIAPCGTPRVGGL